MTYSQPIVGGNVLLRQEMRSENYVQGVSGWRITRDGDAEFNDIVARGDITASSLTVITQEGIIRIPEGAADNAIILEATTPPTSQHAIISTDSTTTAAALQLRGPTPQGYAGLLPSVIIRTSSTNPIGTSAVIDVGGAGVNAQRLRPSMATLGNNAGRTVVATAFTATLGADTLSVTIPPTAESDTITVGIWAQCDVTANASFISYEVRVTNAGGAQIVAPADDVGIIVTNVAGPPRPSRYFEFPVSNALFRESSLFVRIMARTSAPAGDTLTIQRAKLWARCEP